MPQDPKSEKYKARRRKYQMEYHKKPEQKARFLARQTVYRAIRAGKLKKPLQDGCEMASISSACFGRIQAHHDDYSQPLKVKWVCKHHHNKIHGLTT